jgi:hypothetical protein
MGPDGLALEIGHSIFGRHTTELTHFFVRTSFQGDGFSIGKVDQDLPPDIKMTFSSGRTGLDIAK